MRAFSVSKIGPLTVFCAVCITTAGLVNLYSASAPSGFSSFHKQLVWTAAGTVLAVCAAFAKPGFLFRNAELIFAASMLSLAATVFFGVEVGGSKSWIPLGPFTAQPSEFSKIALILVIAKFYARETAGNDEAGGTRAFVKSCAAAGLTATGIMVQPDTGTTAATLLVAGSMIAVMGMRAKTFFIAAASGAALLVPLWSFALKGYQKARIIALFNSDYDPLGSGYNSLQSKIAVGAGKLFGKGFMSGTQSQLNYLPTQETDFVLAVLCEEWGFAGMSVVLCLYLLLLLSILDTAGKAKNRFQMLVCSGIAALFFWHIFINASMALAITPVVGIPLPFMSYGGSSALTFFAAVGLVCGAKFRSQQSV